MKKKKKICFLRFYEPALVTSQESQLSIFHFSKEVEARALAGWVQFYETQNVKAATCITKFIPVISVSLFGYK